MLASAAYLVKAAMRAVRFADDPAAARVASHALTIALVLALVFVILAVGALQFRLWALVTFVIVSVVAALLSMWADVPLSASLMIGAVCMGAVMIARRDLL